MLAFLDTLVSWVAWFANVMASWKYTASTWVWPLNTLYGFFVNLSTFADNLFTGIYDFRNYIYVLENRISVFFSWDSIIQSITSNLSSLSGLVSWFSNWYMNVIAVIDSWFSGVLDYIKSLISTATQGLAGMIAAWDHFYKVILPTLFDVVYAEEWWHGKVVDLSGLIASSFTERADLWRGWSDFRDAVIKFITEPWDWLLDHFADWFLGRE